MKADVPSPFHGPRPAVPVLDEAIRRQRDDLRRILAAYGRNAGPNGLHDLRVALRRSAALGRLLGGHPGPKDGREVRKLADRLRRYLSPARQRQVSLELVRILTRKDEALHRLVATVLSSGRGISRHPGVADVQRSGGQVLSAMDEWRESISHGAHNRASNRKLGRSVERRVREGAREILEIGIPGRKALHPQRIACKKLRYELEILRDVVPGVERVVKASRRAQEVLGDAHDWDGLVQDLEKAAGTLPPREKRAIADLISRAKSNRRRTSLRAKDAMADFLPLVETLPHLVKPVS